MFPNFSLQLGSSDSSTEIDKSVANNRKYNYGRGVINWNIYSDLISLQDFGQNYINEYLYYI